MRRINRLGDWMLGRLVPDARAAAACRSWRECIHPSATLTCCRSCNAWGSSCQNVTCGSYSCS